MGANSSVISKKLISKTMAKAEDKVGMPAGVNPLRKTFDMPREAAASAGSAAAGRKVTKPRILKDVSDEDKRKQAIGRRQGTLTRSLLG